MTASLSRSRRRRIESAQDRVDLVTEADARFFKRFPHRNHRVRHTAQAELEANAAAIGVESLAPEPGRRWYTVVKQIAPGIRCRLFVQNAADVDPDMPEDDARQVYEFLSQVGGSRARKLEGEIRAVVARRGGL